MTKKNNQNVLLTAKQKSRFDEKMEIKKVNFSVKIREKVRFDEKLVNQKMITLFRQNSIAQDIQNNY